MAAAEWSFIASKIKLTWSSYRHIRWRAASCSVCHCTHWLQGIRLPFSRRQSRQRSLRRTLDSLKTFVCVDPVSFDMFSEINAARKISCKGNKCYNITWSWRLWALLSCQKIKNKNMWIWWLFGESQNQAALSMLWDWGAQQPLSPIGNCCCPLAAVCLHYLKLQLQRKGDVEIQEIFQKGFRVVALLMASFQLCSFAYTGVLQCLFFPLGFPQLSFRTSNQRTSVASHWRDSHEKGFHFH